MELCSGVPSGGCEPPGREQGLVLRNNRRCLDGSIYEYWTLCQTIRTERGTQRRVVAQLGRPNE
jgi:hypothetical protein